MLLLSFVLGDCDQTDNEYGDNDAHFTFERGQNSYLKSNRDILCIQEKLRKSQVDDKVKSRTEKESGSVIFAPLGILTHARPKYHRHDDANDDDDLTKIIRIILKGCWWW